MKIIAIIPARMAATRFPGKPLARIFGLPMIEHVRRRVNLCDLLDEVIVATCDDQLLHFDHSPLGELDPQTSLTFFAAGQCHLQLFLNQLGFI